MAFGEHPFKFIRRLVGLAETLLPPTPSKLWQARDMGRALLGVGTKARRSGPVMAARQDTVDLSQLPALTTWPEDGGPFLTLPLVYTEHPEGKGHNLGVYRMQIYDEKTTGMHWQIGKGGGFHYAAAEARGELLPVTVFLGGPPALQLAGIAPLPENVPELLLASLIAARKLALCPGPGAHDLVCEAEFALIGKVAPHARRPEGPLVTTMATTRCFTIIRSSMLSTSGIAEMQYFLPRWLASRAKRISLSEICSRSCCRHFSLW